MIKHGILYSILPALLLISGCATMGDIQRANAQLRTDILRELNSRDKHENDFASKLSAVEDFSIDTDERSSRWHSAVNKRLLVLEDFKAHHDKRWPHLIDKDTLPAKGK